MYESARGILGLLYHPEAIYLTGVREFSSSERRMVGEFMVPECVSPARRINGYVTAGEYLGCLEQLSCALTGLLAEERDALLEPLTFEMFVEDLEHGRFWPTRTAVQYGLSLAVERPFTVAASLVKVARVELVVSLQFEVRGRYERGRVTYAAPFKWFAPRESGG
jgi:hypothetical protein